MIGRSSLRTVAAALVAAGIGLALGAGHVASDQSPLVHQWCHAQHPPEPVIETLVVEAEATGMPEATIKRLLAAGYRSENATGHLRDILCTVVLAEEEGLPPGLLFDTLEEGLGKRVALPRILAVIRQKVDELRFARGLLDDGRTNLVDDPNVDRVARVLSLGLTRDEVSELFEKAKHVPIEMRVIAAEIMGYGRALHLKPSLIRDVIATGIRYRAFTADWIYFTKVIAEARRRGIPDAQTAETAVKVLAENGALEELIGELGLTIAPQRNSGG